MLPDPSSIRRARYHSYSRFQKSIAIPNLPHPNLNRSNTPICERSQIRYSLHDIFPIFTFFVMYPKHLAAFAVTVLSIPCLIQALPALSDSAPVAQATPPSAPNGLSPSAHSIPPLPSQVSSREAPTAAPISTATVPSILPSMQPQPQPQPEPATFVPVDTCGTSYKFVFDAFTITGNFDVGPNGEKLRAQVSGCDGLTDWKFTGSSPGGWTATGHTLVGNKACLGRAVVSAGGSSKGGCVGAG